MLNMIRKTFSQVIVLFGMLVFLLSACGTGVSETTSADDTSPTASPAPKELTFIEFFAGT